MSAEPMDGLRRKIMRSTVLLLWAFCLGCGDPSEPSDGGVEPDAGVDAGELVVCAADRDCDDGAFCTGDERCRIGDPEADARGCVALEPPCEAGTCDEDNDRCGSCSAANADRDGDGEDSIACGGTDCDDDDGRRRAGATEVCDAFHLDEDCRSDTSHAGPGTLGDMDRDERVSSECANVIGGIESARGDDCDDSDPGVYTGAPERCNAIDDTCDDALDEDFECIQSLAVIGTNACDREGTRRCSESCVWIDDGFHTPESAATCDYCDDTGEGIGEEIPFATEMFEAEYVDPLAVHGDAYRTLGGTYVIADEDNARGGVYSFAELELGYGVAYVEGEVLTHANRAGTFSSPIHGAWSLVLIPVGSASTVGSGMDAVPDVALAVTWSHTSYDVGCEPFCLARAADAITMSFRNLAGYRFIGSDSPPAGHQDGPAGNDVSQLMTLAINPDDPRTAADESEVYVFFPIGVSLFCENDGAPEAHCGFTFTPGARFSFGIVAGSSSDNDIEISDPRLRTTNYGACP
jgi:hypothetical protein